MLLTKDQILNASDRVFEFVDVPEWGKDENGKPAQVRLGAMTSAEADAFEAGLASAKEKGEKALANFRARYVARCIVDEDGKPLFTGSDVAALGNKSAAVVRRLFDKAREINGMTAEDAEEFEGN